MKKAHKSDLEVYFQDLSEVALQRFVFLWNKQMRNYKLLSRPLIILFHNLVLLLSGFHGGCAHEDSGMISFWKHGLKLVMYNV